MQYVDFYTISRSFQSFWAHEYTGRCICNITAPKNKQIKYQSTNYDELVKYWTNEEEILRRYRAAFENTYFLGEAFPLFILDLGAGGHAGYFNGIKYQFADNTVWFFPLEENEPLTFSKENFLYRKTIEIAKYAVNESRGNFIVSMPDNSGNLDALAHLRGSENLLMNMITSPETVLEELKIIQKAWETMTSEVYDIVKQNNYGGSSIGWMGTYAKGLHFQLQSDISVMLSPDFFHKFVFDELKLQSDFLDYATYHLDGAEQIRFLDELLSIEKIKMIQYTCVVGQPSPLEKIDVLKKIQKSGKLLLIMANPEWVKPLLENLSASGLFLKIALDNPEQADDIFKIICRYSKER